MTIATKRNLRVFITALLAAVMVLATLQVFGPDKAAANPPGAPAGKLAFKLNYIATPNGDVGCGAGHRVFTKLGAVGHILWTYVAGGGIGVDDCMTESIDGDVAEVHADEQAVYKVFVRILGSNSNPDNWLSICRNTDNLTLAGHDDSVCELGSITLTRSGADRFTFPKKLFDDGAVGELWHMEPGTGFRIAEIRLYAP